MATANSITTEKVLELLRAWSQTWRWQTAFKQLARWQKLRNSVSDEQSEKLHGIYLASVNERHEIAAWLRANGLFDIAGELPVLQIGDVKPDDDAIRDAAKDMQRVLFAVERHLAEPEAETTKAKRISSDTKSVRSWPPIPVDHDWGGLFLKLRKEFPERKNKRAICKEFIEGKRGKSLDAAEKAASRNKHFWHPEHASDK